MFSHAASSTLSTLKELGNQFELVPYNREPCRSTLPILALLAAAFVLGLIVNKAISSRPEEKYEPRLYAKRPRNKRSTVAQPPLTQAETYSFEATSPTYFVSLKPGKPCKGRDANFYLPELRKPRWI